MSAGILAMSLLYPAPVAKPRQAATLDTDPNLVGWWKFDESAGNSGRGFRAGTQRDGTLEGGLSFEKDSAPGRTGKAIRLDGKSQCIEIKDYKGIVGTRPRTVAAWIKTHSLKRRDRLLGQRRLRPDVHLRLHPRPHRHHAQRRLPLHESRDRMTTSGTTSRSSSAKPRSPNLHDDVKLYLDGELAEIDDIGLLDLWPIETGQTGRPHRPGIQGSARRSAHLRPRLSDEEIKALFKLRETDRPVPKAKERRP